MKRVKVKFAQSIAVLGDPKTVEFLDEKYKTFAEALKGRDKPPSAATIKYLIDEKKRSDRYGEPLYGFSRDMAWKPGDEVFLPISLALKWEQDGICAIVPTEEPSKNAA